MMIAEVGSIAKVTGMRIAIVATGPMPGRTPIRVPIDTPMKQARRLVDVKAVPNPKMR
jgi:hypothetical protein